MKSVSDQLQERNSYRTAEFNADRHQYIQIDMRNMIAI